MVATSTLIIVAGGLTAIVGGIARLFWKAIVVIGLLVTAFGLLNLLYGWVK